MKLDTYKSASYKDILQVDGAFAVTHFNYAKSPVFDGLNATSIVGKEIENRIRTGLDFADIPSSLNDFKGTLKDYDKLDRLRLWKSYFMEYANAFGHLIRVLPKSIVTIFVARQAVEIGMKYLLLNKSDCIITTHNLKWLVEELYKTYNIYDNQQYDYMKWVDVFLENYSVYIEDKHPEYFRYPEYSNVYFAGICYDIEWLSYNFYLIILKLLHMAELSI